MSKLEALRAELLSVRAELLNNPTPIYREQLESRKADLEVAIEPLAIVKGKVTRAVGRGIRITFSTTPRENEVELAEELRQAVLS